MIVYLITNIVTGKKYVGKSTRKVRERWKEHCSEARQGRKKWKLYEDMRELGFDKFTIEVLGECDEQARLNGKERRYIKELKTTEPNGYNLRADGSGGGLKKYRGQGGQMRPQEVKDKIRETVLAAWARKKNPTQDVTFP